MKVLITTDLYTTNTNGVVTSVRNLMEEFCDIIDAILRNPAQRQAAGDHSAQIASCFDKSNFAEKMEDIYESVML